ncbi:hypothetical protein [Streptomyces sp. NPDC018038]|uniref:hypothetical protein n=1 Tax=Streptomyces sp. NPDC018038 TaxID=3365036 RepID=UPI003792C26C
MGPGWDTGRGRATGFPAARRARAVQATGAASRASYSSRAAAISFFGSAVGIAAVTAVYGISGGGLDGVRAALVVPLAMVALGAVVTATGLRARPAGPVGPAGRPAGPVGPAAELPDPATRVTV